MRIGDLVDELPGLALDGDPSLEVRGVSHDSRRVRPGWIFAAVPGHRVHGADFVAQAMLNGAVAVLSDRPRPADSGMPWLTSPAPRRHMAAVAWLLAGEPQKRLRAVGVTGTNGKSTTVNLIAGMLSRAGEPTVEIGTLGLRGLDGVLVAGQRTTPEATDLAPLLAAALADGAAAVAMEASSHALVQERLSGIAFDAAVWTNLTRDHLDYHGDMEGYFSAKRRLFEDHLAPGGRRVLPVDDPWAARLLAEPRREDVTWGIDGGDVRARDVSANLDGLRFELVARGASIPVEVGLVGTHNLRNVLAAAATAWALGASLDAVRAALAAARPLPGRLEPVDTPLPFPVFVDYAHTPGGLQAMLAALCEVTDRRLLVVFGAGGDRDRGKREPMGRAVGELADLAIVTSDNPRSEDPQAIADAVAGGVRATGREPLVVLDRREAIAVALSRADDRSLVVVAGKGHEAAQTIGAETLPFSDVEVVREEAGRMSCG